MGYIQELRALIGHRPIVTPGVLAVIRDGGGRVLFIRRSDFGNWALPGGMVEPGQSVSDALVREVREEAGLEVRKATPFALYSHPENAVTYPNGDQIQPFAVAFLVGEWSGEPKSDGEESLEVAFFPIGRLPEAHPAHQRTLNDLQRLLVERQFIVH